jgi:hypothetical protein
MIALPAEQDKLLKELNDLDTQERLGLLPERSNLNLIMLCLIWLFAIIVSVILITKKEQHYINGILILCSCMSVGLIGSFYNKKWGFFLSAIFALGADYYITTLYKSHFSHVVTLTDALTVFIFANHFHKKGYIAANMIVIPKVIIMYFLSKNSIPDGENIVASIVITLTIGIIPVLLTSLSKISRKARKQEIRSEILSLQNQDLLNSWQDFYQSPKMPASA